MSLPLRLAALVALVGRAAAFGAFRLPPVARHFERIATFLPCADVNATCDTAPGEAANAEIVAPSQDGTMLYYTSSVSNAVGMVDITTPEAPVGLGFIDVGGEPTSLVVAGEYVVVAVNTAPGEYVNPTGEVRVLDKTGQSVLRTIDVGGQPDAIAVSPDGRYIAVAVENERDEDAGDGRIPQAPPGHLAVISGVDGDPSTWTHQDVSLTGLPGLVEPSDPEPEFVSINEANIAVVTLQENNGLVLVNLATLEVSSASAGTVDLDAIDKTEDDVIMQVESLAGVPREPDGVVWLSRDYFVTADEGDMDGGSRGFTIYDTDMQVVYSSGNTLEHATAAIGHYPESRSENKGNEPENVFAGRFGRDSLLFVVSERSSVIFVFDVTDPTSPVFKQVLPSSGVGPEGGAAIPGRNLAVVASEEDDRAESMRSTITIYRYVDIPDPSTPPPYPTLVSADRQDGTPIPWGALSGLTCHNGTDLYAVADSFYAKSRILKIDGTTDPAEIQGELPILDTNNVLRDKITSAVNAMNAAYQFDFEGMFNDDGTVNLDPEGVAFDGNSTLWVASEGKGSTVDGVDDPFESINVLVGVDMATGVITRAVTLPAGVNNRQVSNGFKGVEIQDNLLVVVFQSVLRSGAGFEENPRIGVYNLDEEDWFGTGAGFARYILDAPESLNGGTVGMSDITRVGDMKFHILETDDQYGPDAAVKRVYEVDLSSISAGQVTPKTFVKDLLPNLQAPLGLVPKKVEGLAYCMGTNVTYVVNDNDGVKDNSGETQLMRIDMGMTA